MRFSMKFRSLITHMLLLCSIYGPFNVTCDEFRTVNTRNGLVRGKLNTTLFNHIPYYSFKGIPYAKPPIGNLRFKAPEPTEPWRPIVLDAFEHGNICIQPGQFMPLTLPQSENCLTLNIFVPANISSNEKLAVLMFIHGGGYVEGSSDEFFYGHDFLIEKQIILVTMNYRLGMFGFLSLGLPEYSGNMGLKDQQMALKWLNENIDSFGGDNKRITILGHSAGSAATHFQILSLESRKYFRNAICMSGSVENFWAMATNNDNLNFAYHIAKDLNESKSSQEELLTFLHSVDAKMLNKYNQLDLTQEIDIIAAPVVERKDAKRPFLVDTPEHIYKSADIGINVMFSHNSLETLGTIFKPGLYPTLLDLNNNFNLHLPFRGLTLPRNSEKYRSLTSEIRRFYFGNDTIDKNVLLQYATLFSDVNFVYGIQKAVKLHASKSNGKTFYHRFSVDSELNLEKKNYSIYLPGASHGDELCYIFRCAMGESVYNEIMNNKNDKQLQVSLDTINTITKLISNFIKYDEPSYEDDPISGSQPVKNGVIHFLDITNEGIMSGLDPNKSTYELWASIEERARHS